MTFFTLCCLSTTTTLPPSLPTSLPLRLSPPTPLPLFIPLPLPTSPLPTSPLPPREPEPLPPRHRQLYRPHAAPSHHHPPFLARNHPFTPTWRDKRNTSCGRHALWGDCREHASRGHEGPTTTLPSGPGRVRRRVFTFLSAFKPHLKRYNTFTSPVRDVTVWREVQ